MAGSGPSDSSAEAAARQADIEAGVTRVDASGEALARSFPDLFEAATEGRASFKHVIQAWGLSLDENAPADRIASAWLFPRLRKRFGELHGDVEKEYYCRYVKAGCILASDSSLHSILNEAPAEVIRYEIECKVMAREARLGFTSPRSRDQLNEALDHAYSALTRVLGAADLANNPIAEDAAKSQSIVAAGAEVSATRARVSSLLQRQARYEYFQGVLLGVIPTLLAVAILGFVADHNWNAVVAVPQLIVAITMATLGAVVSVVQRMSSGNLIVDYTAPTRQLVLVGALRPLIGAIFGAVAYLALLSGVLASGSDSSLTSGSFAIFGLTGFTAGFSERFATDMLERAGQLLGPSSPSPKGTGGGGDANATPT